MFPISGQTSGPNGLKFLSKLMGSPGGTKPNKHLIFFLIQFFFLTKQNTYTHTKHKNATNGHKENS